MDDLAPNAFIGRTQKPTDADLSQALGSAKPAWDEFIDALANQCDAAKQEWKCYSSKVGWSLRILQGKRTIVWMAPCEGCFRAAFVLGDKAVAASRESGLPARLMRLIAKAPKYPEGTGVRIHVKSVKEIPALLKLARVKMEN